MPNTRQKAEEKAVRPPQSQKARPGKTELMQPEPEDKMRYYTGSNKLRNKVAIVREKLNFLI